MSSLSSITPFYIPQSSDRQVDRIHQLQNKIEMGSKIEGDNEITRPSAEGQTISGGKKMADAENLEEVSRQFESIFIHQMLKAMRKTVVRSDLLGSFAGEQYESMMDEELSKEISKHKGIGLAEVIHRQLEHLTQPQLAQPRGIFNN